MILIDPSISSTGQCGIDELVVVGWKQYAHPITKPAGSRSRGDASERSVILSFFDCRISCFVLVILVVAFITSFRRGGWATSSEVAPKMRHMHRMYPRYDIGTSTCFAFSSTEMSVALQTRWSMIHHRWSIKETQKAPWRYSQWTRVFIRTGNWRGNEVYCHYNVCRDRTDCNGRCMESCSKTVHVQIVRRNGFKRSGRGTRCNDR